MSNPVPNNLALSVINTNDPISSAPLRNDFSATQTAVNELIACLSGGTSGQLLSAVDGSNVQWVNHITYRKTSTKQVVNTVTETDLLNGEITVGAGVLGTNGLLRVTAFGDSLNNSGATQNGARFKLKLGSTTLFDTGSVASAWPVFANRTGWRVVAEILNLGAANSQWATFQMMMGQSVAAANAGNLFTTGEGIVFSASGTFMEQAEGGVASAVDTTSAQALALSVTLPAANASLDVTLKGALVEIV